MIAVRIDQYDQLNYNHRKTIPGTVFLRWTTLGTPGGGNSEWSKSNFKKT